MHTAHAAEPPADPYLWLEDVAGEKPLEWVRERNVESVKALAETADFAALEARIRSILDSKDRIPMVSKIGRHVYNFWRDAKNPKGVWRRTTLEEYRKPEPAWETVLDLDALAAAENENWVWHGASVLKPEDHLCLVSLSRGGADADVVREFDLTAKQFMADGFSLPEAKSQVAWRDRDSLFVATDFGPGSLTTSGYPRTVREWTRGTPLASAPLVYEGRPDDMRVVAYRDLTPGFERDFVQRQVTFWTNELFLRRDGRLIRVEKPDDANAGAHREWLLIELRSDWTVGDATYRAGSLLATDFGGFLAGGRMFHVLFEPTDRTSLVAWAGTRHHVLITTLDNVRSRVDSLTFVDRAWARQPLAGVPEFGTASATAVDELESDACWLVTSSPLEPSTLALGSASLPASAPETQALARFLQRGRPDGRAARSRLERRNADSVFPDRAGESAPRRLRAHAALRLRRVRDSARARLQRGLRIGLARTRPRVCDRQHPGRRRVRPAMASGGAQGTAAAGLSRLQRRG